MKRRPKSKLFPYHWAAWLFTVVSRSTWIFLVGQFKFNNDVKCSCPSFHQIDRKVPWVFVTGRPWWGDVSKLGGSRSIAGVEQRVHLFYTKLYFDLGSGVTSRRFGLPSFSMWSFSRAMFWYEKLLWAIKYKNVEWLLWFTFFMLIFPRKI